MTTLVVGASGATGRLLVQQLLDRGESVRIIVRTEDGLRPAIRNHENLSVIRANLLDLDDAALSRYVRGCDAVASCLGHNITFKGMFGNPRRLVTDAVRKLCNAIKANKSESRLDRCARGFVPFSMISNRVGLRAAGNWIGIGHGQGHGQRRCRETEGTAGYATTSVWTLPVGRNLVRPRRGVNPRPTEDLETRM